jgi:hypothetical protein
MRSFGTSPGRQTGVDAATAINLGHGNAIGIGGIHVVMEGFLADVMLVSRLMIRKSVSFFHFRSRITAYL